jgi:hypothetical protein
MPSISDPLMVTLVPAGAGSVVTQKFAAEATPYLIAGNPAIIKKRDQPHPAALASVND